MEKIEFERSLIDLSNSIVNNYHDFDSIDSLYLSLIKEYKNLSKELYNTDERKDVIYLTSLISKFELLSSQIEIKRIKLRKNEEANEVLNIKYVREIVLELFKKPGLSHKQLAEALGVDKTILTKCIDRIYNKDIIEKNKVSSKSVYYYLTDFGRLVYDKIDAKVKREEIENTIKDLITASKETLVEAEEILVNCEILQEKTQELYSDLFEFSNKINQSQEVNLSLCQIEGGELHEQLAM